MKHLNLKMRTRTLKCVRAFQLAVIYYGGAMPPFHEALERALFAGIGCVPLNSGTDTIVRRGSSFQASLEEFDNDPETLAFKQKFIELLGNNPNLL